MAAAGSLRREEAAADVGSEVEIGLQRLLRLDDGAHRGGGGLGLLLDQAVGGDDRGHRVVRHAGMVEVRVGDCLVGASQPEESGGLKLEHPQVILVGASVVEPVCLRAHEPHEHEVVVAFEILYGVLRHQRYPVGSN